MNAITRAIVLSATLISGLSVPTYSQNSFPPPGSSSPQVGNSYPAPGNNWGSPWNSPSPPPPPGFNNPDWQNNGTITVVGCGYDAYGVWRTVPMHASYSYNGIQYQVTILSAWDPTENQWDYGINVPAVTSTFLLRGIWYNYYVVLSYGTFYFNL